MNGNNEVLFEQDEFRLMKHIEDEHSTLAHRCSDWSGNGETSVIPLHERSKEPLWRWFWGPQCSYCGEVPPDHIKGLHLLHNFDRFSK